jgi:hypothetical protein
MSLTRGCVPFGAARREAFRALLIAVALAGGCATPAPKPAPEEPSAEARAAERAARSQEGIRFAQVDQYLIIPVQWLRADEAAETLLPILQSRYGPAVRVIPHVSTNQLLVYIPTHRETEESLRGGQPGTGTRPGQTAQPTPPRTTAPPVTTPPGASSPTSRSRTSTRRM